MATTARRGVSIFINGREVENSIKGITAEKRKLVRELNKMTIGTEEYEKQVKDIRRLDNILTDHRGKIRGVESGWRSATGSANKFLGGAKIAAAAAFSAIAIGASQVIDEVADTVREVNTLRKEITQLTRAGGKELDLITVKVRALGKTFDLDTNETLRAGNALVKEFGVSYGEAFDIIAEGNIRGANASGEFLENIREYSVQFAEAGFSAEEFLKISVRAQQEGIFSDKGLDLVKEFGLRIREQTPAVIDALDGAFGKGFTDRITKGINEGKITTAQALKEISKEISSTEIPANKLQTVLADVFAGPGEDAGLRFIGILQDSQEALSDVSEVAERYAQAQREVFEANTKLAAAENELAKATFDAGNGFNIVWTRIKTIGIITLATLINGLDDMVPALDAVAAHVNQTFTNAINAVKLFAIETVIQTKKLQKLSPFADDALIDDEIARLEGRQKEIRALYKSSNQAFADAIDEGFKEINARRKLARKAQQEKAAAAEAEVAKKAAEKQAEQNRKEAERELKDLERRLQKVNETVDKYQQERALSDLSENERRLEKIREQYAKEIEETEALELSKNRRIAEAATAQKIELLRLQSEALEAERQKISEEETAALLERLTAENEAQLELEATQREARAEALAEIKEFTDEALKTDFELELERLTEQGNRLLELAASQGEDTVLLKAAIEARKAEIDERAKEQELKREEDAIKAQQALQDAKLGLLQDLSRGLSEVAGENETLQKALFLFNKGVAAAEVIVNLQREIATINATYAAAPPVAIALSTIARVRAGISLATIAATAVTQKKRGGWATVRGADDGQVYNARLIGQPSTGLLNYPHPVLTNSGILANEIGKEYYVSHTDLRNPSVLNHVRAIDNITQHRQRQAGGFAPTSPAENVTTTAPAGAPQDGELNAVLALNAQLLAQLLRQGVKLQLGPNEAIALSKYLDQLNTASGGRAFS